MQVSVWLRGPAWVLVRFAETHEMSPCALQAPCAICGAGPGRAPPWPRGVFRASWRAVAAARSSHADVTHFSPGRVSAGRDGTQTMLPELPPRGSSPTVL